ncbi:MAG TPA: hypothetical protein DCZ13_00150, partial [Porticoccaceae bacterium]|nr:hypothetical protein [Porticoccaceae bacterium]
MKTGLLKCVTLFFTLALSVIASHGQAASYFVNATHGDDGNSGAELSPWATFARAWQQLEPGDTLYVSDGIYSEPLRIPLSGRAGAPITVKATTPGEAIIATRAEPAIEVLNQAHLVIEGISARTDGESSTIVIGGHDGPDWTDRTHHIVLRQVSARGNAIDGNGSVVNIARSYDVLAEDIWAYGNSRTVVQLAGNENLTLRRAVIRWDGWRGYDYNPNNYRSALLVSNTVNSLFENLIIFDGHQPGYGENPETSGSLAAIRVSGSMGGRYTPFDGASNNRFKGIIILNNQEMGIRIEGHIVLEDNHFSDVVVWDNSGYGVSVPRRSDGAIFERMTVGENGNGVYFGQDWDKVYASTLVDSIIYNNDLQTYSFGLRANPKQTYNDRNFITGHRYNYYGTKPGPEALLTGPKIDYLPGVDIDAADRRTAGAIGAEVIYRSNDGSTTLEPLWPYPNEGKIKEEMCSEATLLITGRTGTATPDWCQRDVSLSSYIWQYLGN